MRKIVCTDPSDSTTPTAQTEPKSDIINSKTNTRDLHKRQKPVESDSDSDSNILNDRFTNSNTLSPGKSVCYLEPLASDDNNDTDDSDGGKGSNPNQKRKKAMNSSTAAAAQEFASTGGLSPDAAPFLDPVCKTKRKRRATSIGKVKSTQKPRRQRQTVSRRSSVKLKRQRTQTMRNKMQSGRGSRRRVKTHRKRLTKRTHGRAVRQLGGKLKRLVLKAGSRKRLLARKRRKVQEGKGKRRYRKRACV